MTNRSNDQEFLLSQRFDVVQNEKRRVSLRHPRLQRGCMKKSIYNALLVSTEDFKIDLSLQLMRKQNEILKGILKLSGRFIENPPDVDEEKVKAYDRSYNR